MSRPPHFTGGEPASKIRWLVLGPLLLLRCLRRAREFIALVLGCAALLCTSSALAQPAEPATEPPPVEPTADAKAHADSLFKRGQALVEAGDFEKACPLLAESLRLDFGLGTLLYLSDCQEGLGQTASALAGFKEAEVLAKSKGQTEREEKARARVKALEAKLSMLKIDVAPENKGIGMVLKRNGVAVVETSWGQAFAVDPGEQQLVASAPGYKPWSSALTVSAGPASFDAAVPALEKTAEKTGPVEKPSGLLIGPLKIAGLSVAGVGLVGLAVGTGYGVTAINTYDDALRTCEDENPAACTYNGVALQRDASSYALISTITLSVGGAAVLAGALMFFLSPSDTPPPQVGVSFDSRGAFFTFGGAL